MNAPALDIVEFGEVAWLARIDGADMTAIALAANAVADRLRPQAGIMDAVAGIDSVLLRFDPAILAPDEARQRLEAAIISAPSEIPAPKMKIEIPVCYGGEHGPDLEALSNTLSLSMDEIIRLHASQKYRVLTIGFAPGFAYLGPLPEGLRTQRLATPRARVPAGSVGIAGAMTGVYPLASPGGWPLIGRTPKKLFDGALQQPFVFSPGAEVTFAPISEDTFSRLEAGAS